MALSRKTYWDTRELHDFLVERAQTPFSWGSNDCACFAADGILAQTGTDIMADLRGYTTEIGAKRKIKAVTGGTTLADAVSWCASKHGMTERLHSLTAQRGELVLFTNGDQISAGLVHLSGRHVISPGDAGLERFPITAVTRAWSF